MLELKDLENALNESYNIFINAQAEVKVLQKLIAIEKLKQENANTENAENATAENI